VTTSAFPPLALPPLALLRKHGAVMDGVGVTNRKELLLDGLPDSRDWKLDMFSFFKRTRKWR
jgi:hypothetical protein